MRRRRRRARRSSSASCASCGWARAPAPASPADAGHRRSGTSRRGADASLPRRRLALALALAPVAVAAVGAGLALRGDGEPQAADPTAVEVTRNRAETTRGGRFRVPPTRSGRRQGSVFADKDSTPEFRSVLRNQVASDQELGGGESVDPSRATDVDLLVELRLRDADELAGGPSRP